jgi:predicted enzyme related to lactoylglutathione lyase
VAKQSKEGGRGVSFGLILLITAVVGTVAGAVLGGVVGSGPSPEAMEEIAQKEIERVVPRGAPTNEVDPMAPDPASLSGIPPYPGVYPRRLAKYAMAQQGPMSISWFSTQDPWNGVLDFYEQAFRAEGRKTFTHRRGEMGYVAWLDAHYDAGLGAGVLHMVTAMRQFSQTVVLISASRPDLMMNSSAVLADGLQLPPNSSEPQSLTMGDSATASQVVYARALNLSPQQVVDHFAAQFKQGGFEVVEQSQTAGQSGITGKRGKLTVNVAARAEGTFSSMVLTYDRNTQPEEGASP